MDLGSFHEFRLAGGQHLRIDGDTFESAISKFWTISLDEILRSNDLETQNGIHNGFQTDCVP
jgi:hypothetical protein